MNPVDYKSDSKKWDLVKKNLEDFLEDVTYNAWIKSLQFEKFDKEAGSLILKTENEVIKAQLEDRYKDAIITQSLDIFGVINSVSFLLESEVPKQNNKKEKEDIFVGDENYLNPRYTFETFVVGDNNRFAQSCALQVAENAENPNDSFNPLFIYGGSGLGKTHLMCAIGYYIHVHYPNLTVRYVSSEMFTNDYVNATMAPSNKRSEHMHYFKEKYRNVDVLMIDDIQFIESKEKTIEEVFWTYQELYSSGKQLIFTSDKPPRELLGIDERLRGRLSRGITVDLQPPSFEVKVAILKKKAIYDNIPITDGLMEVIELISSKIKGSIRDMEGAFNKVVIYSSFSGTPISKSMAPTVLSDILTSKDAMPTPENIKKCVAKYYDISVADIESSKKARSFSFPRQIAMYLCKEMTDATLEEIGISFGKRDHTTVIYGYDKINKQKVNDGNLSSVLNKLEDQIRNN